MTLDDAARADSALVTAYPAGMADPPILTPNCPRCDSEPLDLGLPLDRQRLCPNDNCKVFMWDPCVTAEEFEATARTIDIESEPMAPLPTSGGVPLTDEYVEELAAEAEAGYDPDRLIPRPVRPDAADR